MSTPPKPKPQITKVKTTSKENDPNHTVPLAPQAELHLLVGSKYGDGDKESPYGHTAVYIKLQGKEYIYDFGRYGRIKSETIGPITLTGSSSPRGEGILKVWNSFQAYISDENRQGIDSTHPRVTYDYGYKIFDHQAKKTIEFYGNLTNQATLMSTNANFKKYLLSVDYFALGPNCTTQSLEAARLAIPNLTKGSEKFINPDKVLPFAARMAFNASDYKKPNFLFLPSNLYDYLETSPSIKIDIKTSHKAK